MGRYIRRALVVEADQWFKNGDHPLDRVDELDVDPTGQSYIRTEGALVRRFRSPNPEFVAELEHQACGRAWHDHGWIDTGRYGHTVCPGDFILVDLAGERYPCREDVFRASYDPYVPGEVARLDDAAVERLLAADEAGTAALNGLERSALTELRVARRILYQQPF